ncbi:MAG: phosphodiester glycosidase family protein [Gaiellaceae bacterium]
MRKAFLFAALAAVLVPVQAGAQSTTELAPGVTYTRDVKSIGGRRVVSHVITAPAPGGLYDIRPVLSNDVLIGRETVSAMQRRLTGRATLAGVNGDLFDWTLGNPSGIYMRDGVLVSRPQGQRSVLAFGLDGLFRVAKVGFFGSWQVAGNPAHPLFQFNRPLAENRDLGIFTRAWGPRTPRQPRGIEVVLQNMPPPFPNTPLQTQITAIRKSTGGPIPAGGAVIQAREYWRIGLLAEAAAGRQITLNLKLKPWWDGAVSDAVGGGPVLVRNGTPVFSAGEEFSSSQLRPRHPRTAVGQLADGRILLAAFDGRRSDSAGLSTAQLAAEMARLGAQTAMAFDAGGSTTIAWDGKVLNTPSDGRERAVANSVMVFYYGVYVRPPRFASFSPNGDRVKDVQRLAAKVVRRSAVDAQLFRPNGELAWRYQETVTPTTIHKDLGGAGVEEGRWKWVVRAVDEGGRESTMTREFTVNSTLGFMLVSKKRVVVRPRRGGRVVASWRLANTADLRVRVVNAKDRPVRRLYAKADVAPANYATVWNGKNARGKVVPAGLYTIEVRVVNALGVDTLERTVRVRRVRRAG